MINIHISKLIDLLEEAYDAGWCGCKELKKDAVLTIIENNFPQQEQPFLNFDCSQLTFDCVNTISIDGSFSTTTSF